MKYRIKTTQGYLQSLYLYPSHPNSVDYNAVTFTSSARNVLWFEGQEAAAAVATMLLKMGLFHDAEVEKML